MNEVGEQDSGAELSGCFVGQVAYLAARLARHPSRDRALALDHCAQPLSLPCMGIAPSAR